MSTRSLLPAIKAVRPRCRRGYSHRLFRLLWRHQCSSVATCNQPPAAPALVLGAAQLVATHDLATNVGRIIERIVAAGHEGIDLLAFAEAATTGESPASAFTDTGAHTSSVLMHVCDWHCLSRLFPRDHCSHVT